MNFVNYYGLFNELKSTFYDILQGFIGNGVHLLLSFPKVAGSRYTSSEFVDFSCEMGKVSLCPMTIVCL